MTASEFSRLVRVDQIPSRGTEMRIEAGPEERAALAERFGLQAIGSLRAELKLKAIAGGTLFRVRGDLVADVVQTCVVTLEPIPAHVEESFALIFGPGQDEEDGADLDMAFEDEDPPEPVEDGAIDVGEAVAQHLSLALDPFPRKEGVGIEEAPPAEVEEEAKPNPFAVLARLREKKG